jgi:hypothetical protein
LFLEDLPRRPEALQTWKEVVRKSTWKAFERAASFAGTDAAALKAAVRARAKLGYSLNELIPIQKEEVPA